LSLYSGKRYGLVGPNGAGKTTFIKLICGLLRPTKGSIHVFSLDPWEDRVKVCRRIGVLHEETLVPPIEKVFDIFMFVGKLKGLSIDEAKREAEDLLDFLGLWDKRHLKVGTLSAGQRRRLELALAFMGSPELIILDEPTANVDPSGRKDVMSIIERLSREIDATFLISTHLLLYLEKICDEIIFLSKGRVLARGSMRELISKYSKPIIRIETSNNAIFAEKVRNLNSVSHVRIEGNTVIVAAKSKEFFKDIGKIASESGLYLYRIEPLHETLETIYNAIVREEK